MNSELGENAVEGVGNVATSVKVLNNTTEKLLDDLKDTIRKGSKVSISLA